MKLRLLQLLREVNVLLTLILFLCTSNLQAQTRTVTGTVRNEKGEAVSGASILVKGTENGTTTNEEGRFSIAAAANSTLQISFVGFETQEVALNGRSSVDVELSTSAQAMSNVVVVAYGSTTRRTTTGAVQIVNTAELKDFPVAQITQK